MKIIAALWLAAASFVFSQTLKFKETGKDIHAGADAKVVSADFEFKNETSQPVTIEKYEASCSCMSVQIKNGKTRYAPGESGTVRATFDMGNFSGEVEKVVTLYLDGDSKKGEPSVKLHTKVHIPVLVFLAPKAVTWETGEKPDTKTIKVTMSHSKPIHITKISSSSDAFSFEQKTIREGEVYHILVTPKATDAPKLGIVRIETDCDVEKHRIQQAFASVRKAKAN